MREGILIEEFHLTVLVRRGLPEEDCRAIRAALNQRRFSQNLRRAIDTAIRDWPALREAKVRLSR
jgi:hypothetical protein